MDILLVDDSEKVRRNLAKVLSEQGHNVVEADNGLSAMSLLKKQNFDFIITDYIMPIMNGIKLIENVFSRGGYEAEQILLITTTLDETLNSKLNKLSIRYYKKPVSTQVILSHLEQTTCI